MEHNYRIPCNLRYTRAQHHSKAGQGGGCSSKLVLPTYSLDRQFHSISSQQRHHHVAPYIRVYSLANKNSACQTAVERSYPPGRRQCCRGGTAHGCPRWAWSDAGSHGTSGRRCQSGTSCALWWSESAGNRNHFFGMSMTQNYLLTMKNRPSWSKIKNVWRFTYSTSGGKWSLIWEAIWDVSPGLHPDLITTMDDQALKPIIFQSLQEQ